MGGGGIQGQLSSTFVIKQDRIELDVLIRKYAAIAG
jgi:hypothetical protein